tara:strand:+ start:6640 stop:7350 length:711 start_codon:yes stop_codon:yes gene_type:complete
MNINKPIPLESDHDWWWYRAKRNFLKLLITRNLQNNDLDTKKILEIGPGLGNNLNLLNNFGKVDILEVENQFIDFNNLYNKQYFENCFVDFTEIKTKYDLIIFLDVLEHIDDTKNFLKNVKKILEKNGLIILSTPAYMSLWSDHDIALKHFRRYNIKLLSSQLSPHFKIKNFYGMNYLLLPIRYIQIKLFKNPNSVKEGEILNKLLYYISLLEFVMLKLKLNFKFGISLFTVCVNE